MRPLSLCTCSLVAASLLAMPLLASRAQRAVPSDGLPVVALHDSIDVTSLLFAGAREVSTDDLKRVVFTRASTCRLPFLIPLCKASPSQLFTDRRRTTPAALGEDITKLRVYYWQRGFREAQVDTVLTPTKRGKAVEFRIVEGEPTRVGTLDVTQATPVLSPDELARAVVLRSGEPLDLVALDTTLARLHGAVWNKGYGDARIDTTVPRPDASHLVPVRIAIDPRWITRVGRVEFEGNRELSDATLRRGTMLRPGALFTRDAVLETQRRLFLSPGIARAVVITPAAGDSVKTLTVAVAETPAHHVEATLGFNTIDFGQGALEVRHTALGAGRWLRMRAVAGNLLASQLNGRAIFQRVAPREATYDVDAFLRPTYQASLTLTQPWIAGPRTSAELSAFAGRRSLVGVAIDEDVGASLGVVRELAVKLPVGLNYRLESTRVQASAVYFCAGYGICDAPSVAAIGRTQRLAPVGVSAWIDRSDDLDVPTRGYTAVVDAEHASRITGSTFAHDRIAGDASVYVPFGKRPSGFSDTQVPKVLAFHARAGVVRPIAGESDALGVTGQTTGILHPRARFYAGGMQSVRGFAENELGPRVLQVRHASLTAVGCSDAAIASGSCDPTGVPNDQLFPRPIGGSSVVEGSVEVRVPLLKALSGVAFADGAYVGVGGLASPARGKGAVTPGAGFRYRSPLGVLRLDFGLRPVGAESLPVVVAVTDSAGNERVVRLAREKSFSPVSDPSPGTMRSIARRIVVHFAMGQAF
ncbi:MAG TPA: BamA/TamA family outer membrane protein [Gemmatimonadaceae bacterium]|nr:BamA/TamA family outer membrane protein [Gemmatimonadaceae bacterium]